MDRLELGTTGLWVSRVGVGTAAFGLEGYGLRTPGDSHIDPSEAIRSILRAADNGINLFDTAPGYGHSEDLLGEALADRNDCVVATKVSVPSDIVEISAPELLRKVNVSLEKSLRALHRETLDVVQIHNATIQVLQQGELLFCLERAREAGKLRCIGASVYGEETALLAVRSGKIQVLQVALSLLDQRMCRRVLPEAVKRGVGMITRSALLKGVLTKRAQFLPESLRPLSQASERARKILGATWESLPNLALRFCLSVPGVHSVLAGIRDCIELNGCLAALALGPLQHDLLENAHTLGLDDDLLINPTHWRLEELGPHDAKL